MNNNEILNVTNRSAGMVVYNIPEEGIRREFMPGETKKIKFEELEKLAYLSGGRTLMENFLQIVNNEVTQDLGVHTEPEYYLDEAGVIKLLTEGSLDEFLDCLDFAPIGVIDLIKSLAVSLPLSDYNKRKALKDKTGFDLDKALTNKEAELAEDGPSTQKVPERRVKPTESVASAPTRRTTPKYNVVTK